MPGALAITALSWAGSREFGGRGWVGYGWDQLLVALVSLAFFLWGVKSGWRTPALEGWRAARARGREALARL